MTVTAPDAAKKIEASMWQAVDRKDEAAVSKYAQQLATQYADYSSGWYSLSQLAYQRRQLKMAMQAIQKALHLSPSNGAYLVHQAMLVSASGNYEQAANLLQAVSIDNLKTAYQLSTAGRVYSGAEQQQKAYSCYKKASVLEPDQYDAWYNLATVARFVGRLEEAKTALDRALTIKPDDAHSLYLMSQLSHHDDRYLTMAKQALDSGLISIKDQVYLHFALATWAEQSSRYETAEFHFSNANKLRRSHVKYSVDNDVAIIDRLIATFDKQFFDTAQSNCTNDKPIFVLGLPRSGTTLIDRAISNNENIVSLGEPNAFNIVLQRLVKASNNSASNLDYLTATTRVNFTELGEGYLKHLKSRISGSANFVDKLPINSLNLGLIAVSLPNAKLIWVRRSAADSLWAIYKTLFESAYPYSYDLQDLTSYLIAHERLMNHFKSLLGERLIEVHYEDYVSDPDHESEKMARMLGGLDASKMATPHTNQQPSSTASSTQVREKVHTKSVGLNTQYSDLLKPYITQLADAGLRI